MRSQDPYDLKNFLSRYMILRSCSQDYNGLKTYMISRPQVVRLGNRSVIVGHRPVTDLLATNLLITYT
jgi:hypothetical protein